MEKPPPSEAKAEARRAAFARRKAAHAAASGAGEAARDRFLAAGLHHGADIVSAYRPIRTEIDPTPIMEALASEGRALAVPVIEGPGLPLRFRAWRPGAAMVAGPFGAEVPAEGDWLEPDLLIVPLVAFSAENGALWRLGYGGGFYDRTLAGLRARQAVTAVGLAFAAQQAEALPRDPTDEPLDAVVTERSVLRP